MVQGCGFRPCHTDSYVRKFSMTLLLRNMFNHEQISSPSHSTTAHARRTLSRMSIEATVKPFHYGYVRLAISNAMPWGH